MPIHPLPQFEEDVAQLEAEDRAVYERLEAPKTIVVRFGAMKMIGEFPWKSDAKPGCGSKIVIRSFRGTEIGEMLTSTCPNAGCAKSVTRKEMLDYIENSGGRQYPFHTSGRAIRVATGEDMQQQERLEQSRHGLKMEARAIAEELRLDLKIVDAEPILGGETVTYYYTADDRPPHPHDRPHDTHPGNRHDLGELRARLEKLAQTRVDIKQVGARDEARLTADYERCGQYCCCKNFLKVLKPVSMKSAKVQKATLDPLKISGRCGRLMCCLRYEDQTYADLRARLPRKRSRVGTPEGDGEVIDTQILTQLALIRLDSDGRHVAVPVEELSEPGQAPPPPPAPTSPSARPAARPASARQRRERPGRQPAADDRSPQPEARPARATPEEAPQEGQPAKKRRRRRRRGGGHPADASAQPPQPRPSPPPVPGSEGPGEGAPRKRRRRRRRRGGGAGEGGPPLGGGGGGGDDSA